MLQKAPVDRLTFAGIQLLTIVAVNELTGKQKAFVDLDSLTVAEGMNSGLRQMNQILLHWE
jgi:hypothetical protein